MLFHPCTNIRIKYLLVLMANVNLYTNKTYRFYFIQYIVAIIIKLLFYLLWPPIPGAGMEKGRIKPIKWRTTGEN